jgi:hypothetical protein
MSPGYLPVDHEEAGPLYPDVNCPICMLMPNISLAFSAYPRP